MAAPPYICASEADIEQFYLDVADASDLPLGIYNNPPRVKTDLHWDQLLRLFQHPNIVIHKESTARVGQIAQILAAAPDVSVMCCDSPNLGLVRSEEHTSELQSLMRISYAVFCLKKKKNNIQTK